MGLRLGVIAGCVAIIAGALVASSSAKNACVLVTNAEASRVIGVSVRILPGESTASCNILRGTRQLGIVTAYADTPARYRKFRSKSVNVTAVPQIHPTAFEIVIGGPAGPGDKRYGIFALAAGHRLMFLSYDPLITRAKLRQLMRIALKRA
jgi:hypothetical protein